MMKLKDKDLVKQLCCEVAGIKLSYSDFDIIETINKLINKIYLNLEKEEKYDESQSHTKRDTIKENKNH